MKSHREILISIAEAIQASTAVANYCYQKFGRALAINVGAYANGIPGEEDSPFLWIRPADEENMAQGDDETFVVRMVVAGCVKGTDGESYIENVVTQRTASVNGLTVNGGNKIVEDLRDMIIAIVKEAKVGAFPVRIRRDEDDISHYPLEWAAMYVEYNEPSVL